MTPRQLLRRFAVLPVKAYRAVVSPLLPASCIYSPTCSSYAEAAILRHGIFAGGLLAAARVARCAAVLFTGGEDPVPEAFSFRAVADGYRKFRRRRGTPGGSGRGMSEGESGATLESDEGGTPE